VRRVSNRGISSYELIAGERRFRAATAAGLSEIPAVIRDNVNDKDSLALALIENIQRENLNSIETAQAYDELLHTYNLTQTELAQALGKSQPQIANTLRLLNLPLEIQESVRTGRISDGHAKVILSVVERSGMLALWTSILAQDLTVRQAEAAAGKMRAEIASPTSPRKTLSSREPDEHLAEVGRKISLTLGTKVRIVPGRGEKGSIEITYFNLDQLEGLIERLAEK
jgi:ParB family chromosome partitioning protein